MYFIPKSIKLTTDNTTPTFFMIPSIYSAFSSNFEVPSISPGLYLSKLPPVPVMSSNTLPLPVPVSSFAYTTLENKTIANNKIINMKLFFLSI